MLCMRRSGGDAVLASSVYEFGAANDLGELIWSIEFSPFLLRALAQLEGHGQRRLAARASLGPVRAEANPGEGALDGVRRRNP